jgi:hypothetical protein
LVPFTGPDELQVNTAICCEVTHTPSRKSMLFRYAETESQRMGTYQGCTKYVPWPCLDMSLYQFILSQTCKVNVKGNVIPVLSFLTKHHATRAY